MARTGTALVMLLGLVALSQGARAGEVAAGDDQLRSRDDEISDLKRTVGVLVDEVSKLRTQVAVPEDKELTSLYGFGPAASKIYGVERGLSLGGYGEGFYRNFIGDEESGSDTLPGGTFSDSQLDRADFLRLVMYLGYKFNEKIVFNSEIEFEHALIGESTPSSGSGTVGVEFAALDFFWKDWANARVGLLLLPMGFLNEVHEPPFFHGVARPEVETRILPTTWRENGAGLFGRLGESVEYRTYVVTGFNAAGFSDAGIRGGRQQGNRALSEDLAWVGRLDWTIAPGILVGGSAYVGDSGQDQSVTATGLDVPDASLRVYELHAQLHRNRWEARALFALSQLSDARDLNLAFARASNRPIAEEMIGGYGELAYDIGPWLFEDKYLAPFVRVEYVDTQWDVPSDFDRNDARRYWLVTPGISYKPHPNVVLKLEYRNFMPTADAELPDELSFGFGFAF